MIDRIFLPFCGGFLCVTFFIMSFEAQKLLVLLCLFLFLFLTKWNCFKKVLLCGVERVNKMIHNSNFLIIL